MRQIATIIAEGMAAGDFAPGDPTVAARAVFDATGRFHNPAHAGARSEPGIDEAFEALVVGGLRAS